MKRTSMLLRNLTLVRRAPGATRAFVADALWLGIVIVALVFPLALDWFAWFVRHPWLAPIILAVVFPWVEIKMSPERVKIRRWVGPVPFGRCETLAATGRFGSAEPFDSEREMLVSYSDSEHHVFCVFPHRLVTRLNSELARVIGGPSHGAPNAHVVKRGPA